VLARMERGGGTHGVEKSFQEKGWEGRKRGRVALRTKMIKGGKKSLGAVSWIIAEQGKTGRASKNLERRLETKKFSFPEVEEPGLPTNTR